MMSPTTTFDQLTSQRYEIFAQNWYSLLGKSSSMQWKRNSLVLGFNFFWVTTKVR